MENIGREPSTVHGTIHGPGYSGAKGISSKYSLSRGKAFSDSFHIVGVNWTADFVSFYADGKEYSRVKRSDLPAGAP
ncbi:MAG: family 16 glycosylhydrolase [Acidobacteriales bacterium]|nr:family 16 glycosylhydrolase [Terriglobales bacterium]